MKLHVDGKEIYTLEPWQEAVIKSVIKDDVFVADMERRARYIWEHKFEQCYAGLEKEWLEKLRADPTVQSIPKSKKEFAELVLAHPEYKSASMRTNDSV